MRQFKGTPGPWEFNGTSAVIAKDTTVVIGNFFGTVLPTRDNPDWKLISAAPELLEVLTHGQTMDMADMLDWVADRLVYVHHENENMDYIISLRERANLARAAITKVLGE